MTKTEKVIERVKQKDFKGALSIVVKFRLGFTQEEKRSLAIANDVFNGHSSFYEQLGIDVEHEIEQSVAILNKKYAKV